MAADDAYCIDFLASEPTVRHTLGDLRKWMRRVKISADTLGTIELVLAEALNNIVEHAYAQTGQGHVHLCIRRHKAHLAFELLDQGGPLPGLSLPLAALPGTTGPICDLPEGGFGWFLIHRLTSDLSYQRIADENRLTFKIRINPPCAV
jgi:serine/threonine-protein kinase RsbW